ncbi:MAG: sensor histidine kinase [Bacteroidia bacterium]
MKFTIFGSSIFVIFEMMKQAIYILIGLVFSSSSNSFAKTDLDSLAEVINTSKDTIQLIETMHELSSQLWFKDFDSTLGLLDKAISLSTLQNDTISLGKLWADKANVLKMTGNYKDAEEYFDKAASTIQKNSEAYLANALNYASLFKLAKNYEKSVEILQSIITPALEEGYYDLVSSAYLYLGEIHATNNRNRKKASEYYDLCIENARLSNDPTKEFVGLYNAANNLWKTQEDSLASVYLNQLFELQHKRFRALEKNRSHSYLLSIIGASRASNEEQLKALHRLRFKMKKLGQEVAYSDALLHLVNAHEGEDSAVFYGKAILKHSIKHKLDYSRNIALGKLANEYYRQGELKKSIGYLERFITLNDSLNGLEKTRIIEELNVKYESEKKGKEIAVLAKDNTEKELLAARSKTERNGLMAALAIVLIITTLVIYFFYTRNLKQKLENQISKQKIKDLEQKQQILTMNSMIEGQENERRRIAQDLHDGLGAMLSTIKMHFSNIQNEMTKIEKLQNTNTTASLIEQANLELRKVAHEMMPGSLVKLGLKEAIRELCNKLSVPNTLEFQFASHGFEVRLSETKEVMLYRAIQEIMNNAIKHSKAKHVIVQLMQIDDKLQITVEDDGVGFNLEETRSSKSLGLKGIKSRIEFLNGILNIESTLNVGSTFTIEISKD